MSSATSIDGSEPAANDAAFRPWQFFLLAGLLAATATVLVATGQSPAAIVLLSLTVVAASFVGLAVYRTLAPLVSAEAVAKPTILAGKTRIALEREKLLVLRSIKELEFDFAMKKVSQADFDEMAGRLRGRALRLMRQLDAGTGYRSEIERELQVRLGSAVPTSPITVPAQSRETTSIDAEPVAVPIVCAACETANDADARFCKECGARLNGK
jgi:hypothetical protein